MSADNLVRENLKWIEAKMKEIGIEEKKKLEKPNKPKLTTDQKIAKAKTDYQKRVEVLKERAKIENARKAKDVRRRRAKLLIEISANLFAGETMSLENLERILSVVSSENDGICSHAQSIMKIAGIGNIGHEEI